MAVFGSAVFCGFLLCFWGRNRIEMPAHMINAGCAVVENDYTAISGLTPNVANQRFCDIYNVLKWISGLSRLF